jgi:hypothetical protein
MRPISKPGLEAATKSMMTSLITFLTAKQNALFSQ